MSLCIDRIRRIGGNRTEFVARDAPDWLAPALRTAAMTAVPILAVHKGDFAYDHLDLPIEMLYHRMRMLPLSSPPSLHSAQLELRASNSMHECVISQSTHSFVGFRALAPVDARRIPIPWHKTGSRFRLAITRDPADPVRRFARGVRHKSPENVVIEAHPDAEGQWTLVGDTPTGFEFRAELSTLREMGQLWARTVGQHVFTRVREQLVWRFLEPSGPADALRWTADVPNPTVWDATWAADRLTFRVASLPELAHESAAFQEALECLGRGTLCVTGGSALVPDDQGTVRLRSETAWPAEPVTGPSFKSFQFYAEGSDELRSLEGSSLEIQASPQGGLRIARATLRNDVVQFAGDALHCVPESVRPLLGSEACWKDVVLTCARRGDGVDAVFEACVGVGAEHAAWCATAGACPAMCLDDEEDKSFHVVVESAGNMSADSVLRAAAAALADGVTCVLDSVQNSIVGPAPPLWYPESEEEARRDANANANAAPAAPSSEMLLECAQCGARRTVGADENVSVVCSNAQCGMGRVFYKLRHPDSHVTFES